MRRALLYILTSVVSAQAFAVCQLDSASLKFEGTAFANAPFQLTTASVLFFRGTRRELEITYDPPRDQWCYRSQYQTKLRPRIGCLKGRNGKLSLDGKRLAVFGLHDLRDAKIATLRVQANQLELAFLLKNGKASGKRIKFTAPLNEHQNLEVKAWNCPNENYLSCMGSQLQLRWSEGLKDVKTTPVSTAEMAKNLGHFEASCDGLREILESAPKKPAF